MRRGFAAKFLYNLWFTFAKTPPRQTFIATPYGINIDELNGDVYIADAGNYESAGKVTCFTSAGVKKFSFSVALRVSPNKIVFRR